MLSRTADVALRLVLGVLGFASIVGVFLLLDGDLDLSAEVRAPLTIPLGALFVVGFPAVIELKDKYEDRDLLRFRRWGRQPIALPDIDGATILRYRRPQVYPTASALRIPIHLGSTIATFAFGVLVAGVSWIAVVNAATGDGLTETGLILAFTLPIGLWLSARALLRFALSYRAVRLDATAVTLGVPLGFAWPVRLPLDEINEVVIFKAEHGSQIVIRMGDERSFHIDGRRLRNESEFSAWWADNTTSGRMPEERVEPAAEIGLEPPTARSDIGGPDPQRVDDLRTVMRRRTIVALASLLLATAITAGTAYAYIDLRLENDHLARSGRAYVAKVIDLNRSRRGFDSISVRFVANATSYERTISTSWFKGFRHDLEGENVTVLFDPSQEGMARLPGARNYPIPMRILFLAAPLVLILAAMGYRNNRWHTGALSQGQWKRARVEVGAKRRVAYIRRAGDADTNPAHIFIHNMNGFEGGEAWVSCHDRGVVVLFDDADHWLPGSLSKRSPLRERTPA